MNELQQQAAPNRAGSVPAALAKCAASHTLAKESVLPGPHTLLAEPVHHIRVLMLEFSTRSCVCRERSLNTADVWMTMFLITAEFAG